MAYAKEYVKVLSDRIAEILIIYLTLAGSDDGALSLFLQWGDGKMNNLIYYMCIAI